MSLESVRALRAFHDADSSQALKMDRLTRGLIVSTNEEHQMNRGLFFTANVSDIKNLNEEFIIRFSSNSFRPRIQLNFHSTIASKVEFWHESLSTHNAGSEISAYNMNRHSLAATSAISMCLSPGSAETLSPDRTFYLGHHDNAKKVFKTGELEEIWQLYTDTVFLMRFTSLADNNTMNFRAYWFEQVFYDIGSLIPSDIL